MVYKGYGGVLTGCCGACRTPARGSRPGRSPARSSTTALALHAERSPGRAGRARALLGTVPETGAIAYRALVPHELSGMVETIAEESEVTVEETIAIVAGHEIALAHTWPVRRRAAGCRAPPFGAAADHRPARHRPAFPRRQGSTAAVPGGFGTGKTVLLQQIAKWCDADVIVYVGCGERGNELADVLEEFAELEDPRTGRPLLERTVLDRQHLEHAGDGARGQHLHRRDGRRVLPRHGLRRRA